MAAIEFEPRPGDRSLKRLEIVLYIALAWAVVIGGRLVYLQVVVHEDYVRKAEAQQQREQELPARRGEIFDRANNPLAITVPVKSVCINPILFPSDREVAVELLSRILNIDGRELSARIGEAAAARRGFLWVKRKISLDEAERVANLKLTGVDFRDETVRAYPKGKLAAHVLGGVDHEGKGNAGVELALDEDLEGIPGNALLRTDVRQHGYDSEVENEAQPGRNIVLTIDERVQFVAEEALKEAVLGCRCASGSIVVLEPGTGDVLAMTNYPTYDPNVPPKNGQDPARLNLAVSAPYEPGSVFKLITLATALEKTHLRPDSPVNCLGGRISFGKRVIREAKGGFGVIPMRMVLAKSSNIGAIQIALTAGPKNLHEYIRAFGFGRKTGIELPAESGGTVHPVNRWGSSSIGSIAIGHEVTATTLQLAQAGALLANDGVMVPPRIVLSRQTPGSPVEREPAGPGVRVLTSKNAALMREMMRDVVRKGGTGVSAKVLGYTTGGKTGSAQLIDRKTKRYGHKYNASFVGMAPLNRPAVVVVVTLTESTEYGGKVAAPVFNKVAAAALRVLDVPMDDRESLEEQAPPSEELSDVAVVEDRAGEAEKQEVEHKEEPVRIASVALDTGLRTPDFLGRSLREVLAEAAATGIAVETRGKGISKVQRPPPGDPMRPGQKILVQFGK
ncbi:MAG: penicillin-binding protein [Bryobacteraceae bacterium]|nr:penicillin-binding protein [Bryobacteraceae bacterium]